MTAVRDVDPDFLALPLHALADAALPAALAAGASYADLRIHRINTEFIQMRDGELESSVLTRELGLAVRVIVAGTWGFASHAELSVDVAAATARRAVEVANTLAALNAEAIELARDSRATEPVRAWRITGAAACRLHDPKLADEAFRRVRDAASRQYLVYACQRSGMSRLGRHFRVNDQE